MEKQNIAKLGLVSLLFAFFFGGQLVISTPVFATTASTISLDLGTSPSLDLVPGKFGQVSQNISVTTDNYTGYTLSLTNSANTTDLVEATDNSLTIPTITLPSGSSSIISGAFDEGYGISTDGTNFVPAPTSSDSITIDTATTSGTNTSSLTFGVKPASSTASGAYSHTFVVTAIVNDPQYSIVYDENTTDTASGMPSDVTATTSATGTVTLSSDTPTRSGYTFLGWDEDATATAPTYPAGATNTITLEPTQSNALELYAIWEVASFDYYLYIDDDGIVTTDSYLNTGDASHTFTLPTFADRLSTGYRFAGFATTSGGTATYQSGDTITLTSASPATTLYAVWETAYMQSFSCSELTTTHETALLTDSRDDEQYNVSLLADGMCWMTDNLRLGLTAIGGSITLTPDDTDITSNYTLTNIQRYTTNQDSSITTWAGDTSERTYIRVDPEINGGLYNWYAATAGNTTSSGTASHSICPAGWRLPTGNYTGEFHAMLYAEGVVSSSSANGWGSNQSTTTIQSSPLTIPLAGYYYGTGLYGLNTRAGLWTSTAYSSTYAYIAEFVSSSAGSFTSTWERGRSVRCVMESS